MNFVTEKLEEDERKSLKLGPQKEQQQEYRRRAYAVGLEPETSQVAVTGVRAEKKIRKAKVVTPLGHQTHPSSHQSNHKSQVLPR